MSDSRGSILWVDDEIEHLKPHILFLKEKGYALSQASNGQDAIELCKVNESNYSLSLINLIS